MGNESIEIKVDGDKETGELAHPFRLGDRTVERFGVYKDNGVTVWVTRNDPQKKEVVLCLCGRNVCQVCGVCETHCKCQKKEIEPINPSGRVIPIPKGMDGLVNVFYGYTSETIQKLNEVIVAVNELGGK